MVHPTVKGLLGLISTLIFIVLVALAALAWRLSQGPLSLSFLTQTVEQALNDPARRLTMHLEEPVLQWDPDAGALELRLRGVKAQVGDRRTIAAIPEMSVSISGAEMLRARLAFKSVRLLHPALRLLRLPSGAFALGLGAEGDADAAQLLDAAVGGALTQTNSEGLGSLTRIEIANGDMAYDDPAVGVHWRAMGVDLALLRVPGGVSGTAKGALAIQGQPGTLAASGLYEFGPSTMSGTLRWTGLRPDDFAKLSPPLAPLARFKLITGGTADFKYGQSTGLSEVRLDANGGPGSIDAAPWIGTELKVNAVSVRGKMSDAFATVAVDELRVDLGGPKLALSGRGSALREAPKIEAAASLDEMPIDTIKAIWPADLAPNPRAWIVANLAGGAMRHAALKLAGASPAGGTLADLDIQSLSGEMRGDGMTVHYLGSLASVRGVAADATFDQDGMTIAIKSGSTAGIAIKESTIKLSGFRASEQNASFDIDTASSVADALKLIDAKPLGFAGALGFDPAHAKGDASIRINVSMPLTKSLRLAQLKLRAHAVTHGLAIPKAALGLDLTSGNFDVDLDPKGMDVSGTAQLSAIPIALKWRENFAPAAFRSRYDVSAQLDDAGRRAIGLTDPAFQPPVLAGTVPIAAVATMTDASHGTVHVRADLTPAAVHLPGLNWSKAPDEEGHAEAELKVNGSGIAGVPRFTVGATKGMEIHGEIAFDAASKPQRIRLTEAKFGRTDLKGTILFKPDGSLGIDISGASFDAAELAGGGRGERHVEENASLSLSAKLGRVWLSEDGSIRDVSAILARGPRHWRFIRLDAQVGDGKPMRVDIRPTDSSHRALKVTSDDAGATFAAFGIVKTMRAGKLAIDGIYDDSDSREPLVGSVHIADYRIVKAPLLARMLTVASLTGAGDILNGSGIHFSKLDAPFTLVDGIATFKKVRATGTELALTADGQVDLDNDQLALEGTIIPANFVNGAVGSIPLIGKLLTGEAGGLIGFNYAVKGPSGNPNVSVNPLSALTPGILRDLFGAIGGDSGTKVPGADAKSKPVPDGADR